MNEQEKEKRFVANVKKALDLGEEHLDAGTQSKLTRIRHQALDAGEHHEAPIRRWFMVPVAGLTTACAIVLGVAIYLKQPSGLQTNLEDLDLLVAEENLEFYDGLEFYAWLAEEEIDAG